MVTPAGFVPSEHDPTLFVHTSPHGRTLFLLYEDDMIITGDESEYIAFVKARLREKFLMSYLGPLRYFLGIEVSSAWLLYLPRKIYSQSSCSCWSW